MKKSLKIVLGILFIFSGFNLFAQDQKEIHKTFEAKNKVRIETVSGDCTIRSGDRNEIKVDVLYSVHPEDAFEADIQERSDEIKIKERWHGRSSGKVTWTITVPKGTDIRFSTASGDLSIDGIENEIEASTASGDITITNSQGKLEISTASGDVEVFDTTGEFDLSTASGDVKAFDVSGEIEISTASGDIRVKNSRGEFDLSCASGDIEVSGITLEDESSFSTASGDIEVGLAESLKYDLECSAASGDVELDYNGNEIKGFFEFTTKKHSGNIRSPLDFDTEEEYERGGRTYVKKSFSIGGSKPRILLSSSSGDVVLKK